MNIYLKQNPYFLLSFSSPLSIINNLWMFYDLWYNSQECMSMQQSKLGVLRFSFHNHRKKKTNVYSFNCEPFQYILFYNVSNVCQKLRFICVYFINLPMSFQITGVIYVSLTFLFTCDTTNLTLVLYTQLLEASVSCLSCFTLLMAFIHESRLLPTPTASCFSSRYLFPPSVFRKLTTRPTMLKLVIVGRSDFT